MRPKVSVIIPAFNAAATLRETLASICAQRGVRYEIVVVDDGSSDHTASIVETVAPSAKLVRQSNSGRGTARNVGFENSTGEYVYFFDADDIMEPGTIHRLSTWLDDNTGCDVAYGDCLVFCENPSTAVFRQPSCDEAGTLLHRHLNRPFILPITAMMRRQVYERVGGMHPKLRSNEDWHFWLKVSVTGSVFQPIGGPPVARYRTYSHSRASSLIHPRSAVESLEFLQTEYGHLVPHQIRLNRHIAEARADYARTLLREGLTKEAWREWVASLRHSWRNFRPNAFVFCFSLMLGPSRTEAALVNFKRFRTRLKRKAASIIAARQILYPNRTSSVGVDQQ